MMTVMVVTKPAREETNSTHDNLMMMRMTMTMMMMTAMVVTKPALEETNSTRVSTTRFVRPSVCSSIKLYFFQSF